MERLYNYLKNKRVAVVGNGKLHPLGGKQIDLSDVVIKFNNGVRFNDSSRYGNRCDVLVSAQLSHELQIEAYERAKPTYLIRWGKGSEAIGLPWLYLDDVIKKSDVQAAMNTSKMPTTGACFLTWLNTVPCEATLYGFDHLKHVNWYDKRSEQIGTRWHDGDAEAVYIESIGFKKYEHETNRLPLMYCQRRHNAGDMASGWLYEKITGKKAEPLPLSSKHEGKHLAGIGSIVGWCNDNCHVWGSGMISAEALPSGKPTFYAVRGKLTREKLIDAGHDVPEVYGDPAILLPDFLPMQPSAKYDYAIIPHYIDVKKPWANKWAHMANVKIIDITQNIESVIYDICSARVLISSSLHALIFADAYGVPAFWVKSNDVVGHGFKFRDYFSSIGMDEKDRVFNKDGDIRQLLKRQYIVESRIQELKKGLYESCPY